MKQYTLYLGLNDKITKVQEIATIEAYKIVKSLLSQSFDGGTIFEAMGVYRHENGDIVTENTLRIELLEFEESIFDKVKTFVKTLKSVFNQESIAVQVSEVNSELW